MMGFITSIRRAEPQKPRPKPNCDVIAREMGFAPGTPVRFKDKKTDKAVILRVTDRGVILKGRGRMTWHPEQFEHDT